MADGDALNEIPTRDTGKVHPDGHDLAGMPIMRREMTADEVKERVELNVAVTASSIRARAMTTHSLTNGHGPRGAVDFPHGAPPSGPSSL